MGDNEETDPDRRMLRSPCEEHGMQHGYFTREDDGKPVELRCAQTGCDFRVTYKIEWPNAFKVKPA